MVCSIIGLIHISIIIVLVILFIFLIARLLHM
nr:MAG TPA: Protein of unknown function (DUF2633) [Microviridae sp.]